MNQKEHAHNAQTAHAARTKGMALVALSTITWGSGGLFVRLLPYDFATILFWRGLFTSLFIGVFVLYWYGPTIRSIFQDAGRETLLIALCSTASTVLFIPAVQHTSIANAFTLLAALPFIAAAFAWLWMRERPSGPTMAASAIAFVGILIMFRPTAGGPRLGDLLALLGTVAQALMTVAIRRNPHIKMMPVAWLSIVLSVMVAIPLADSVWSLTPRDYAVTAAFGLIAVALGQMLYMIGSAFIPAPLTTLIGTMEAPIAALWAWMGVGEIPETATIVGGTIVVASVVGRVLLEQRWLERRQLYKTTEGKH